MIRPVLSKKKRDRKRTSGGEKKARSYTCAEVSGIRRQGKYCSHGSLRDEKTEGDLNKNSKGERKKREGSKDGVFRGVKIQNENKGGSPKLAGDRVVY